MKILSKLGAIFMLALLSGLAFGQTSTTVTTTSVVDSDSTIWANGSWSIAFRPNPSQPNINMYNINGVPLDKAVLNQSGALNSVGAASVSVYNNTAVSPSGSTWVFTACPLATSACGVYTFPATGSALDITVALNAVLPPVRFPAVSGSYGYADVEAILTNTNGGTYWNNFTQGGCQRYFNSVTSAWACGSGGGGGGGTIGGGGDTNQYAKFTSPSAIGDSCSSDDGSLLTIACANGVEIQGTSQPAEIFPILNANMTNVPTNYTGIAGAATGTPNYLLRLPNTNPAGQVIVWPVPSMSNMANQAAGLWALLPISKTSSAGMCLDSYDAATGLFTASACGGGSGSGTVNTGTACNIAWYVTTTNAVNGDGRLCDSTTTLTYSGSAGLSAFALTLTGTSSGAVIMNAGSTGNWNVSSTNAMHFRFGNTSVDGICFGCQIGGNIYNAIFENTSNGILANGFNPMSAGFPYPVPSGFTWLDSYTDTPLTVTSAVCSGTTVALTVTNSLANNQPFRFDSTFAPTSLENQVTSSSTATGTTITVASTCSAGTYAGGVIHVPSSPAIGGSLYHDSLLQTFNFYAGPIPPAGSSVTPLLALGASGLVVGGATGGFKGAGSINMHLCFIDGVACGGGGGTPLTATGIQWYDGTNTRLTTSADIGTIYDGTLDTGTTNNWNTTLTPAPTVADNAGLCFYAINPSTGGTATLTLNSVVYGAELPALGNLVANDVNTTVRTCWKYNGGNSKWDLQNPQVSLPPGVEAVVKHPSTTPQEVFTDASGSLSPLIVSDRSALAGDYFQGLGGSGQEVFAINSSSQPYILIGGVKSYTQKAPGGNAFIHGQGQPFLLGDEPFGTPAGLWIGADGAIWAQGVTGGGGFGNQSLNILAYYQSGTHVYPVAIGTITLGTGTSDNATISGVTVTSNCTFTPTNSTAAAVSTVLAYISSTTTNTVTITHAATVANGATLNIHCALN